MKPPKVPLTTSPDDWNNPFATLSSNGLSDAAPVAEHPAGPAPKLGRVVLRREKAHRGGKTVIVVDQFAPAIRAAVIEELAGKLKRRCGCGGTVKDRTIEVQGDQPAKVRAVLEAEGFRVDGVR